MEIHMINFAAMVKDLNVIDDIPNQYCQLTVHEYCENCKKFVCGESRHHKLLGHTVVDKE